MDKSRENVMIKVIVLGCANVGKTSLMERFATGKFSGIRRPTVGADFMAKKLEIHDAMVSLQIWDTAGQERFHHGTLSSSFYRGAHGALLVYDVNNENSIEQVLQWREECLSRLDNDKFFPIVVIGNKVDLRSSDPTLIAINQGPILSWCRENSYGHIETSAKDGNGVQAAILAITALALEYHRSPNRSSAHLTRQDSIALNTMYERKSSDVCGTSCNII